MVGVQGGQRSWGVLGRVPRGVLGVGPGRSQDVPEGSSNVQEGAGALPRAEAKA